MTILLAGFYHFSTLQVKADHGVNDTRSSLNFVIVIWTGSLPVPTEQINNANLFSAQYSNILFPFSTA